MLLPLQVLIQLLAQLLAQCFGGHRTLPQVQNGDLRQQGAAVTLRQRGQQIFPLLGAIGAFDAGGGGSQHAQPALAADPQPGDFAGVVAGGLLAAVGVLLFLIHDDEPQIFHRGENGGTGADHHIHRPAADPLVFIQPLAEGKGAVDDGDPPAEGRQKAPDGLRGQGDLRHQHDAAPPLGQYPVGQGEVNGGLAAAGNAVQKAGAAALPVALPQRFHRGGLCFGELGTGRRGHRFLRKGGAQHLLLVVFGRALLYQLFHYAPGHPGKVADLPDAAAADLLQQPADLLLLGGQAGRFGAGQPYHLQRFIADPPLDDLLAAEQPQRLQPFQRQGGKGQPQAFRQVGGGNRLAAGTQVLQDLLFEGGKAVGELCPPHQRPGGKAPQAVARRDEHRKGVEPGAEGVFPQPPQQKKPFLLQHRLFLQHRRHRLELAGDFGRFGQLHYQPHPALPLAERDHHPDAGAERHALRHGVIEQLIKTAGGFFHRDACDRGQTAYLLWKRHKTAPWRPRPHATCARGRGGFGALRKNGSRREAPTGRCAGARLFAVGHGTVKIGKPLGAGGKQIQGEGNGLFFQRDMILLGVRRDLAGFFGDRHDEFVVAFAGLQNLGHGGSKHCSAPLV